MWNISTKILKQPSKRANPKKYNQQKYDNSIELRGKISRTERKGKAHNNWTEAFALWTRQQIKMYITCTYVVLFNQNINILGTF